jgi:hypothetical protein
MSFVLVVELLRQNRELFGKLMGVLAWYLLKGAFGLGADFGSERYRFKAS